MIKIGQLTAQKIFLLLGLPLTIYYFVLIDPYLIYPHAPERFLHVAYLAERAAGAEENTLSTELVEYAFICATKKKLQKFFPQDFQQWQHTLALPAGEIPARLPFHTNANPAAYSPVSYLPQLIPVFIGEQLHMSPFVLDNFTRLVAAGFALWLGYYAIGLWPVFQWPLLLLHLVPTMSMYRILVMPDALTTELVYCFIGFVLLRIHNTRPMSRHDLIMLALMAVLIGQCKSVYLSVVVLMGLLPLAAFGSTWRKYGQMGCIVFVSALLNIIWSSYSTAHYGQTQDFDWSAIRMADRFNHVLAQPWRFTLHLLDLATSGGEYHVWLKEQLFWRDVGDDVAYPLLAYSLYGLALATVFFQSPNDPFPALGWKWRVTSMLVFIITFFAILAVLKMAYGGVALFFGASGTKGRYFLPIMPLLWISFGRIAFMKEEWVRISRVGIVLMAIYLNILFINKFL